jgi:hypothetical protein
LREKLKEKKHYPTHPQNAKTQSPSTYDKLVISKNQKHKKPHQSLRLCVFARKTKRKKTHYPTHPQNAKTFSPCVYGKLVISKNQKRKKPLQSLRLCEKN